MKEITANDIAELWVKTAKDPAEAFPNGGIIPRDTGNLQDNSIHIVGDTFITGYAETARTYADDILTGGFDINSKEVKSPLKSSTAHIVIEAYNINKNGEFSEYANFLELHSPKHKAFVERFTLMAFRVKLMAELQKINPDVTNILDF